MENIGGKDIGPREMEFHDVPEENPETKKDFVPPSGASCSVNL